MMELLQWKVKQVLPETKEAATFVLEEVHHKQVLYEAGQFLTFLFRHTGYEIRRSYSLSSTPGIDKDISVTIKKKKNGEISRYLLQHWRHGTLVESILPAGRFTIDTNSVIQRQFFFVAAGSGIVPVFSLLKKVLHHEPLSQVVLIYQNHDERSIIFHTQLRQLEKQFAGRLKRIDLLGNPRHKHVSPQRLNNSLLQQLITINQTATVNQLFYTCGPDLFMRMVQYTVRLMGFTGEQIRKENFTIDTVPAPAFIISPGPHKVTVHYGNDTFQFSTSFPATILQSALDKGIALPYSCRAGRCSACIARCLKGSVKMSHNEVLTGKDLEEGLVLTCVGYAETDIEIQF